MRKYLLLLSVLFIVHIVNGQTNTWIGGATGNWSAIGNWSLGHTPTTAEDVLINTNSNINVDLFVSSVNSINSLRITGGVNATLTCFAGGGGGIRTLLLSSTSPTTKGLQIDAGNTLSMDAANISGTGNWNLSLTGTSGVTGLIDGTLQFTGSGLGTANNARLDVFASATANANLVVSNTGKILYLPNSGNTNSSAGSYLTLQAGAIYEIQKNGGTFPDANWSPTSLAKATNTGNTAPDFNGSVYGNLEWNLPGQTQTVTNYLNKNISFNNVNIISTNSGNNNGELRIAAGGTASLYTLTINGNLDIGANARLVTSSASVTNGNGGIIEIKGNIKNEGTITSKGPNISPNVTVNIFKITGSSPQTFSNTGTFSGANLLFSMQNPSGLTLLNNLNLPYNLELVSGKIKTTATALLSMVNDATWTGGSSTSFVEGPMKKTGDGDFIFPVGAGSIYAPVGIAAGTGATVNDEFTAEYKRSSPQGQFGTNYASGINHISYVEYWDILRGPSTTATKKIMLTVTPLSFCKLIDKTFVSHLNSGQWSNEPSTYSLAGTSGAYQYGTVTTIGAISSFSPFTLATDLSFAANPLPLNLLTFEALKTGNNTAVLKWELAENCSDAAIFEIEKSNDKRTFISINKINGDLAKRSYTAEDNQLNNGVTYYRLKMIDEDGKISYSKVVTIVNSEKGVLITSLSPNPVLNNALLILNAAAAGKQNIIIYDIMGKIIKQENLYVSKGENKINIAAGELAAGIYYITATSDETKSVYRFVKQ